MAEHTSSSGRSRLRDILPQIYLGKWPTGPLNSITDVSGVLVHTQTLQPDKTVNTGVTTILPRKEWYKYSCHAGIFRFNGCGEMTGTHWIEETGMLTSPIILTTSSSVGDGFRGILDYAFRHHSNEDGDMELFIFPLVAETYDGYLNNQSRFAVTPEHIVEGILAASSDRVPEGNTGGGTGMICHRFKGGTGSSSRVVKGVDVTGKPKEYTVGVLVQANYGSQENLHIAGVPVGRIIKSQQTSAREEKASDAESSGKEPRKEGSIIVVIATDVPLLPIQLQRIAKRATVGLAKVGGYGGNSSGDIFLAFSTAAKIPVLEFDMDAATTTTPVADPYQPVPRPVETLDNDSIGGVFEAAADATEEAIYNALCMAESMTGYKGRSVDAIDLDKVREIVGRAHAASFA
ncbi:peptidase family S58-domain-containing protein [Dactylonectria macrodidyma]|uniref:Peptidase family S58-domain-containing protein n=1 Tax=Dactylonectria macrodidyma TaxID=307937 RepID=A0A9P9JHD1_9HYPO|nr:peptidase family S58-domain-containing protein [Dactylonectria macrodidyma]